MGWESSTRREDLPANWEQLRKEVLQRDRGRCQLRLPGCRGVANEVDHINDDRTDHRLENLQALCAACHGKKTREHAARNRSEYSAGPEKLHPGRLPEALGEPVADVPMVMEEEPAEEVAIPLEKQIATLGPVWNRGEDGKYVLPERTLGHHIILWGLQYLRHKGQPFRLTGDQMRKLLWIYAIDEEGRWLNRKAVIFSPKGEGKDPFGAFLAAVEFVGPCRFGGWADKEKKVPLVKAPDYSWVQIAAVKQSQNMNTMLYLYGIFSEEAKSKYGIQVQTEQIVTGDKNRRIELLSSRSDSLEGNFPTFVLCSEIQHWKKTNGCWNLWRLLERNSGKVPSSHILAITNAHDATQGSVAQMLMENYEDFQNGRVKDPGILMVSKYGTSDAQWATMEQRLAILKEVYGDSSKWQDLRQIAGMFDDPTQDISELLRFYYNSVEQAAGSWVDLRKWDACRLEGWEEIPAGQKIVMAGDFSLTDDSSGLVGMCVGGVLDGTIFPIGVWENKQRDKDWEVPRAEVEQAVEQAFQKWKVLAFWADPSHRMLENGSSAWLPVIQRLHLKFSRNILPENWASKRNAFLFDMTLRTNQMTFIEGLAGLQQEIADNTIRQLDTENEDLRNHIGNARVMKTVNGYSIGKPARKSVWKIDLAVCAGIAYSAYTATTGARRSPKTNLRATTQRKEAD